jgi:glycosyltransferase involved in cell wall biosynthesis
LSTSVHQFLPTFAAGDAIGNHVLRLRDILRGAGYESEIFADDIHLGVRRQARPYRDFKVAAGRSTVMLYHLSTGSPMAEFLIEQADAGGAVLAVYYHNITPAEFFERWEPGAAESVRTARGELRKLAGPTRFAMANSSHSEAELRDEGYSDTCVVPVLVDFTGFGAPADPSTVARLERASARGGAQWLFVGRLAPNKCQHDVIGAFAAYRAMYDPAARLTLVGGKTSQLYHRALEQLVDELDLAGTVELADVVTFPELLAHYRAASVFVCLSEHEGFCVPVLEAMHFGVPVVARATTALPETVGEAGLLVDDRDPVLVATAVHRVVTDIPLRDQLVAAGRERVEHFSEANTARRLLDVVRARTGGDG